MKTAIKILIFSLYASMLTMFGVFAWKLIQHVSALAKVAPML